MRYCGNGTRVAVYPAGSFGLTPDRGVVVGEVFQRRIYRSSGASLQPLADIYPHPRLDLKSKEMLTFAELTVLGDTQAERKDHIRGELNVGCTPDQILENILPMAVYAGFQAALETVRTAASEFSELKDANR